jgi:pimeloyl-ACP methyl ester carboxylesterase
MSLRIRFWEGSTMPSIRTSVLTLSFEVTGPADGPTVLMLHGWPDAARGWSAVAHRLNTEGWRTLIPELRGCGVTQFVSASTPRDGHAVALAQDAIDLVDALGVDRFAVVGHDWGARVAYTLAALVPERVNAIAALALAYQPRGEFSMPDFGQARAFWYQWLMYVDAGAAAIRRDPIGFARIQWETWSPPGWFDEDEFAATAGNFTNPDWTDITLNAYRARFLSDEPRDLRYDDLRARLAGIERLSVPTLMIQGGADNCDEPSSSEGLEQWFTASYRRIVIDGVGHFPHREAADVVADHVLAHLAKHR